MAQVAIETMSPQQLRQRYREIGLRSGMTSKEFNDRVTSILLDHNIDPSDANDAKPIDFVTAAESVATPCGRCAGTGQFITYVENGVPRGPGGICFRCEGKGYQVHSDRKRNDCHDRHYAGRML